MDLSEHARVCVCEFEMLYNQNRLLAVITINCISTLHTFLLQNPEKNLLAVFVPGINKLEKVHVLL